MKLTAMLQGLRKELLLTALFLLAVSLLAALARALGYPILLLASESLLLGSVLFLGGISLLLYLRNKPKPWVWGGLAAIAAMSLLQWQIGIESPANYTLIILGGLLAYLTIFWVESPPFKA